MELTEDFGDKWAIGLVLNNWVHTCALMSCPECLTSLTTTPPLPHPPSGPYTPLTLPPQNYQWISSLVCMLLPGQLIDEVSHFSLFWALVAFVLFFDSQKKTFKHKSPHLGMYVLSTCTLTITYIIKHVKKWGLWIGVLFFFCLPVDCLIHSASFSPDYW